jgi:GNAT superfamily N-acetyltransferase
MPPTLAQARPYRDEEDLHAMLALARAGATEGTKHAYYQIGDVSWQTHAPGFDPRQHISLWEDDAGVLLAFTWCDTPQEMIVQLHPSARQDGRGEALLESILAWGEDQFTHHLRETAATATTETPANATDTTFTVYALEDDTLYTQALTRRGYRDGGFTEYLFDQPLTAPLAPPALPDGWTVRPVAGEEEFAQRVELHRVVWHPSRVTVESYRRLRQEAPFYRPDLDLVAVGPDGVFASYCICWYDEVNHTGEFEPVGTHPDYRQRGLSSAVLREGMRRLQALGATLATVNTGAQDHPPKFAATTAKSLYESAGFRVVNRLHAYRRIL